MSIKFVWRSSAFMYSAQNARPFFLTASLKGLKIDQFSYNDRMFWANIMKAGMGE